MDEGHGSRRRSAARTLAEVALIVIGILLAFSADRWWDGVQRRETERDYLERLSGDFAANRAELAQAISHQDTMLAAGERLLHALRSEDNNRVQDSVAKLLGTVLDVGPVTTHLATYDELKTSGNLLLIRNDSLRALLASFDALARNRLATGEEVWRDEWITRVRPYLESNLSPELYQPGMRIGAMTVPPSPFESSRTDLRNDRELWNLIVHRLIVASSIREGLVGALELANAVGRALER
jgi:hypothetical protein